MIGRTPEVKLISDWMDAKGTGLRALVLSGTAGIGKTRVLEHLVSLQAFNRREVISVSCFQPATSSSTVIEQLAMAFLALIKTRGLQQTDAHLLHTFQKVGDGLEKNWRTARERSLSDLVAVLSRCSQRLHLTLILEDVQWADNEITDLIRQLCWRASEVNARLILTARNEHQVLPLLSFVADLLGSYAFVRVTGLDHDASSHLLESLATEPALREEVVAGSRGNPMCITQLVGRQSAIGELRFTESVKRTIPTMGVRGSLLLQVLSVIGRPVNTGELAKIVGLGATAGDALVELRQTGLIEESGELCWIATASIKAHLYSRLTRNRRKQLHKLVLGNLKRETEPPEEIARHTVAAGLWDEAHKLYLNLARVELRQRRFSKALLYFLLARQSTTRAGTQMEQTDLLDMARCFARTGKANIARKLCGDIITTSQTTASDVLAAAYQLLSTINPKITYQDNIRRAINALPPLSPRKRVLYAHLTTSFIFQGDLASAEQVLGQLSSLTEPGGPNDTYNLRMIRALLLYSRGRFNDAVKLLRTTATATDLAEASRLNYMALCQEATGSLKAAIASESKALPLTENAGDLFGQVSCLQNLGVFATKLGQFQKAHVYFERAHQVSERIVRQNEAVSRRSLASLYADEAYLNLLEGRYFDATKFLRSVKPSRNDLMETERLHCALITSEVRLALQDKKLARKSVSEIGQSELALRDYFQIEQSILNFQLGTRSDLSSLEKILLQSRAMETSHQECRILNLLAESLVAAGRADEARKHLDKGLDTARRHGYRPLAAQTMMLRGLAAAHPKEKARWLVRAYKLAEEIGIPELVAQTCALLGTLMLDNGQTVMATEYLLKSTTVTSLLAEQVPLKYRAAYWTEPSRTEAQKKLRECMDSRTGGLPRVHEPMLTNDRLFRLLYEAHTAGTTAPTHSAFLQSLRHGLESLPGRAGTIVLIREEQFDWQPIHAELTDDLKKRVIAIARKATDKPYFEYQDRGPAKGPVAWLPFRTDVYHGGIYLYCTHRGYPLSENEIEFLTILGTLTANAFEQIQQRAARNKPISKPEYKREFHGLVGASRVIQEVFSQIELAAGSSATVLIEGETGTGKELVARAIHQLGTRAKAPFVPVDCGAIPEGLIESELFGAARGAYTGATADRRGLFETANRGTIFLDEISNTTPGIQVKLLRVLQEREVRRVGDNKARPFDVRLIAASNRSLRELVEEGRFRQDLLYRINVLQIALPPLRNRREDIPLLAEHFLQRLNSKNHTKKRLAQGAFAPLLNHGFPGNVRELQNMVERAFFAAKGATIPALPIESVNRPIPPTDEVQVWFRDLTEGRKNFWTAVHDRYKRRDISRENVVALLDLGLRRTRGSYKNLAALFRLDAGEYRRLMDFLRRSKCLLDFRPYRQPAEQ